MLTKPQTGFTLLELMIGLVLGMLIVAAGLAVFISGQRSLMLQGGMNELQQNANFGLAMLTHDLRHANLNTPSTQKVNNKQVGSGIIFLAKDGSGAGTAGNLPVSLATVNTGFFTTQGKDTDATTGKSDQLTIQYIPAYTKKVTGKACPKTKTTCSANEQVDVATYSFNGIDCEGGKIEFEEQYAAPVIVQRYHIKEDTNQISGQPKAYSLYCDAGHYVDGDSTITGMNSLTADGQQLMQRIDAFKIRLQVKDKDKNLRYMTIDQYKTLMADTVTDSKDYANVTGVEIAILARSTSPLNSENLIDNTKSFNILDSNVTLSNTQKNGSKFLREVFSQMVAFRNTLGASE